MKQLPWKDRTIARFEIETGDNGNRLYALGDKKGKIEMNGYNIPEPIVFDKVFDPPLACVDVRLHQDAGASSTRRMSATSQVLPRLRDGGQQVRPAALTKLELSCRPYSH